MYLGEQTPAMTKKELQKSAFRMFVNLLWNCEHTDQFGRGDHRVHYLDPVSLNQAKVELAEMEKEEMMNEAVV